MNHSLIGNALFTKTQQKVLGLLYGKPEQSFYFNQIVRLAAVGKGSVSRELNKLVSVDLLIVTKKGNQKYYQANHNAPAFNELVSLVAKILSPESIDFPVYNKNKIKISPTVEISRDALKQLAQRAHIRRLMLFGSAVRGELKPESDIDLLVDFETGLAPSLGGMVKLTEDFSKLFNGRAVDLATSSILTNPYRKQAIEKDMEILYAA